MFIFIIKVLNKEVPLGFFNKTPSKRPRGRAKPRVSARVEGKTTLALAEAVAPKPKVQDPVPTPVAVRSTPLRPLFGEPDTPPLPSTQGITPTPLGSDFVASSFQAHQEQAFAIAEAVLNAPLPTIPGHPLPRSFLLPSVDATFLTKLGTKLDAHPHSLPPEKAQDTHSSAHPRSTMQWWDDVPAPSWTNSS